MKPPKTIYLTNGDYDHAIDFENDVANGVIMWSQDKVTKHDVGYIRKDLYDKLKKEYSHYKDFSKHPYSCQMGGDD